MPLATCSKFVATSLIYGNSCVVCGFEEVDHMASSNLSNGARSAESSGSDHPASVTQKRPPSGSTRHISNQILASSTDKILRIAPERPNDMSSTEKVDRKRDGKRHITTTIHNKPTTSNLRSTGGMSADFGRTVGRTIAPSSKQSDKLQEIDRVVPTRASNKQRQADLLALAGDAARHQGDPSLAQTLYLESASLIAKMNIEQDEEDNRNTAKTTTRIRSQDTRTTGGGRRDRRSRDHESWDDEDFRPQSVKTDSDGIEHGWMAAVTSKGHAGVEIKTSLRGKVGDELLEMVGYNGKIRQRVSKLFREFSGGGPTLGFPQFKTCLRALGCHGDPEAYFRSFDKSRHRTWLSIEDFIQGTAMLDPLTPNSGIWRSERAQYIFRYYAPGGGRQMLHKQLVTLLSDIYEASGKPARPREVQADAAAINLGQKPLTQDAFVALVLGEKISGTSRLLRYSLLDHYLH